MLLVLLFFIVDAHGLDRGLDELRWFESLDALD